MTLPSDDIYNALGFSAEALEKVIAGIKNPTDISRHRLLLPDDRDGLEDALFAYMIFMTENPLSGHSRKIKQALGDYNNAWFRLFDAVRESNSSLADTVKSVRDAQKKAHARLAEILESGNGDGTEEFNALADALRDLSEAMGDDAQAAAKRSRKGCKRERFKTTAQQAFEWTGVPVSTLRKQWVNPTKGRLRPPFNIPGSEKARKSVWQEWARQHFADIFAKHEANMKNHPIPLSSVGRKEKRKHGL